MDRRDFLRLGLGATVAGTAAWSPAHSQGTADAQPGPRHLPLNGQAPAPASPLVLWYRQPAGQWLEAQPIGNGRLGAMVYGGLPTETVQLNEGTIWGGGPHDYANPEGRAALPEIRQLVFDGKWGEAQNRVNAHFMGRPQGQTQYQTVGGLTLAFDPPQAVSEYLRQLDLDTAIATTTFVADGARYTREVFASAPDQVIVMRLTADTPGRISFSATFASPQHSSVGTQGTELLTLDGISGDAQGLPGSVKFQALARLLPEGGKVQSTAKSLSVTGANAVTVLISIGSSYRNYKDVGADPASRAQGFLHAASRKTYAQLRQAHVADYQRLFHRMEIDLGRTEAAQMPTDERIKSFHQGNDPALAALYCQYGRYLLISCSRPGGQAATLQGLWNDSLSPPWGSKYTININTEMNYWPAAPGGLAECYQPLFAMLGDLSETGARTAKVQYGAGGWVAHHNTDGWRGTAPVDAAFFGMWPSGGAWLCKSIWDHYQFTGDKKALAAHYPLMKAAAQFFLDTLVEEPAHHWLVTCPSMSPEHDHHPGVSICAGPTMDMQIVRDLFAECAAASELLGVDAAFRSQVTAARARLAPMRIGSQGQLQEWLEDWDAQAPDPHHRHVSHLYGLYPSAQITRRGTPDLFAAARKSLEIRGDESTGWAMAWRINLWARLEDGDHAHALLALLLTPDRTAPNMFDLHPPFQIDGNFGGASGIMEMLLQSHTGELHLLPALPAAWPSGRVRGLQARGACTVDITWSGGKLQSATLLPTQNDTLHVRYGEHVKTLPARPGHPITVTASQFI